VIACYRKAFAALLGGGGPAVVDAILAAFGVHLNGPVVAAICVILASLNTARAKPNVPPPVLRPTD
jgi:hypothetical protein